MEYRIVEEIILAHGDSDRYFLENVFDTLNDARKFVDNNNNRWLKDIDCYGDEAVSLIIEIVAFEEGKVVCSIDAFVLGK